LQAGPGLADHHRAEQHRKETGLRRHSATQLTNIADDQAAGRRTTTSETVYGCDVYALVTLLMMSHEPNHSARP